MKRCPGLNDMIRDPGSNTEYTVPRVFNFINKQILLAYFTLVQFQLDFYYLLEKETWLNLNLTEKVGEFPRHKGKA
jgi:hypothetical protein